MRQPISGQDGLCLLGRFEQIEKQEAYNPFFESVV
jgi:hypothetical protein